MSKPISTEEYDNIPEPSDYDNCLNKLIDYINTQLARKPPYNVIVTNLRRVILDFGYTSTAADKVINDIIKLYKEAGWVLYKLTISAGRYPVVKYIITQSKEDLNNYIDSTPLWAREDWVLSRLLENYPCNIENL